MNLVRPNIQRLKPYSCARDEFKGEARVCLDANESPYFAPYNRYPDPRQLELKKKICAIKGAKVENLMLGNGSDEPIDLVYRIFCNPGVDNVVAIEPTYGMYGVCADINDVEYRRVNLKDGYKLCAQSLLDACDSNTKVIWCCSPNNPSGNLLDRDELQKLLEKFEGIVVIDEAYIDFAGTASWITEIERYPRLIVLQTFSKAWAMAGVRCGMAFASKEIIDLFNKVKYPYNINQLTQEFVSRRLDDKDSVSAKVKAILEERDRMAGELKKVAIVEQVYPSDANFILVKVKDACGTYQRLVGKGIIVRNRHSVTLCGNCLRITVGTREENDTLIKELV